MTEQNASYTWLKELLSLLTITVPPGRGQHHALTLREDGELLLTLIQGGVFKSVIIQDGDFSETAYDLAHEIYDFIHDY